MLRYYRVDNNGSCNEHNYVVLKQKFTAKINVVIYNYPLIYTGKYMIYVYWLTSNH